MRNRELGVSYWVLEVKCWGVRVEILTVRCEISIKSVTFRNRTSNRNSDLTVFSSPKRLARLWSPTSLLFIFCPWFVFRDVNVATALHTVLTLRMRQVVSSLQLHAFMT